MQTKWSLLSTRYLLLLLLFFIGFAYIQLFIRTPTLFYAQSQETEVVELNALEQPNVSTKTLLNWSTLAASASFTFDFVNSSQQLEALKDYFTQDGYTHFIESLSNNKTLETIQEKKLVSSAVATGPAVLLSEEEVAHQRAWRIQVPILVRYQSANVNTTQQQIVEMLVVQVSTKDAPKGIGIAQYIVWNTEPNL